MNGKTKKIALNTFYRKRCKIDRFNSVPRGSNSPNLNDSENNQIFIVGINAKPPEKNYIANKTDAYHIYKTWSYDILDGGYRKVLCIIGGITFFRRKFLSQCRKTS